MELREKFACGTVRIDREEFPEAFKCSKLATGEARFIKNNSVLALHWRDKRDVFAMSTMHSNAMNVITRRNGEKVMKPEIITEYNKYMNGVDKCDQYLNYYAIGRKSMKWWKKFSTVCSKCASSIQWFSISPPLQNFQRNVSHTRTSAWH